MAATRKRLFLFHWRFKDSFLFEN